eukprot:1658141-Rhodomonas_salina.2
MRHEGGCGEGEEVRREGGELTMAETYSKPVVTTILSQAWYGAIAGFLRNCYAMSGTHIAYGGAKRRCASVRPFTSGPDIAYRSDVKPNQTLKPKTRACVVHAIASVFICFRREGREGEREKRRGMREDQHT